MIMVVMAATTLLGIWFFKLLAEKICSLGIGFPPPLDREYFISAPICPLFRTLRSGRLKVYFCKPCCPIVTFHITTYDIRRNPLIQGIYAAMLGFVLGYVTEKYDSVYPSVLLHLAYNFAATILSAVAAVLPENAGTQVMNTYVDKKKVLTFLKNPSDYGKPWYGQLMAGPQLLAYLLQVNYWLKKYAL